MLLPSVFLQLILIFLDLLLGKRRPEFLLRCLKAEEKLSEVNYPP